MHRLLLTAFAAILAMSLVAAMFGRASLGASASAPTVVASADAKRGGPADDTEGADRVTVARDGSGQFHIGGKVNRSDADFLVDTGADVVALTVATAEEAGIPVDPAGFQPMMETASGTGRGARYTVDELEIAGRPFRDVDVVVLEGLSTNLLGQTMLRRLGRVELLGDRMVIERR